MNKKTPHTLNWSIVPHGDGKEALGYVLVRFSAVDSQNAVTNEQLLETLRAHMAAIIDCPIERLSFHPPLTEAKTIYV